MSQIGIDMGKGADEVTYWEMDPSGKKPIRQITERQWNRAKTYITFIEHAALGRREP